MYSTEYCVQIYEFFNTVSHHRLMIRCRFAITAIIAIVAFRCGLLGRGFKNPVGSELQIGPER